MQRAFAETNGGVGFATPDKLPIYAEHGVTNVWLLDPELKTLEVFRLDGKTYRLLHTAKEEQGVRAEPFEAMELGLAILWAR